MDDSGCIIVVGIGHQDEEKVDELFQNILESSDHSLESGIKLTPYFVPAKSHINDLGLYWLGCHFYCHRQMSATRFFKKLEAKGFVISALSYYASDEFYYSEEIVNKVGPQLGHPFAAGAGAWFKKETTFDEELD